MQRVELPAGGGEPRGILIADTQIENTPLRVAVTHLDTWSVNRRKQAAALLNHITDNLPNLALLGDINEWLPLRPYFRRFAAEFAAISSLRTFPFAPLSLLWIALLCAAPYATADSRQIAKHQDTASDHRPLICDVEWRTKMPAPPQSSIQLWQWPNVLALDATLIAILWQAALIASFALLGILNAFRPHLTIEVFRVLADGLLLLGPMLVLFGGDAGAVAAGRHAGGGHHFLALLILGESNNVANASALRENRNHTVETESDATMRRRTIFKSLEHVTKTTLHHVGRDLQHFFKDFF